MQRNPIECNAVMCDGSAATLQGIPIVPVYTYAGLPARVDQWYGDVPLTYASDADVARWLQRNAALVAGFARMLARADSPRAVQMQRDAWTQYREARKYATEGGF